jgi:hypothetical protein
MVALVKEYGNISIKTGEYGDDQEFLSNYMWPHVIQRFDNETHEANPKRCMYSYT